MQGCREKKTKKLVDVDVNSKLDEEKNVMNKEF